MYRLPSKIIITYYYILLVTDQATSNRKAIVQRLSSAGISMLARQPDVTLDKLHKINNLCLNKKTHTTQATNASTSFKNDSVCK